MDFFIEYGIIFRISSTDNQEIKLKVMLHKYKHAVWNKSTPFV
jgi:hypothetical protein